MGSYITKVKNNLTAFVNSLKDKNIDIRMALIDYKDIYADGKDSTLVYITNGSHWHTDADDMIKGINKINATGGGDELETPAEAMSCLIDSDKWEWRDSASKNVILFTDAGYKDSSDFVNIINRYKDLSITFSVVSSTSIESMYEPYCKLTGGSFLNISTSDYLNLMLNIVDVIIESNNVKVERIQATTIEYYGANTINLTSSGEIQNAAAEFKSELDAFFSAFKTEAEKKMGDKVDNLIDIDQLTTDLMQSDASTTDRYLTKLSDSIPADAKKAMYHAIASFINKITINCNLDFDEIDIKKEQIEVALNLVRCVLNGMRCSGRTEYYYEDYCITINATNMWSAFSGQITATKIKGKDKGTEYSGVINSTLKKTKEVMQLYVNQLSDIVKDACKRSLYSIFSEFADVTGIASYSKDALNNFLADKIEILQNKGFGNVLALFVNIKEEFK